MPRESHQPPLDVEQAATYLNISQRHVRRLVAENRIAYLKIGGRLRFLVDDLEQLIAASRIEPAR